MSVIYWVALTGLMALNINAKGTGKTIVLKMPETASTDIVKLINSMEAVSLSEGVTVGEIRKIIVTPKNIYILDAKQPKSLIIFTRTGHYVRSINKTGKGAGEFTNISDFQIIDNRDIVILDLSQKKLIFYTIDGIYQRELRLDCSPNSFIVYSKDKILLDLGNQNTDKTNHCLKFIHASDGKQINHLFPLSKSVEGINIVSLSPLRIFNDTVIYQPSMSNCLYNISENAVNLRYRFDFGKYWPNDDFIKTIRTKVPWHKTLLKNGYIALLNVLETDKFLCVKYHCRDKQIISFVNKQTGKVNTMYSSDDNEALCPVGVNGDSFISAKYRENKNPSVIIYSLNDDEK